jgi:hypothetical protein
MGQQTTAYPTSIDTFVGTVDLGGNEHKIAQALRAVEHRLGTVKATSAQALTVSAAASAITLTVSSGCVRNITTLARNTVITLSTASATEGQEFTLLRTATGTHTVAVNAAATYSSTFGSIWRYVGGVWKLAAERKPTASASGGVGTMADGSVSAPSLAWASDANLGMYRIGGDQAGFSVGANGKGMEIGNFTVVNLDPGATATIRYTLRPYIQPIGGVNESAGIYCRVSPSTSAQQLNGIYLEVATSQADTWGPGLKLIHCGHGDGMYVAQFGTGGAGYECASFEDTTKGFISTNQVSGHANVVLFNALWEQPDTPNYGMFYADQAKANALTIRKGTAAIGATGGLAQIRLCSNDFSRNFYTVYNSGRMDLSGSSATSGATKKESPELRLRAALWSTGASRNVDFVMKHVVATATGGGVTQCRWLLGRSGSEGIVAILSSSSLDLQLNSIVNVGSIQCLSNMDLYVDGALEGQLDTPAATAQTSLLLRFHNGSGVVSAKRVYVGAASSATAGYRMLMVPN